MLILFFFLCGLDLIFVQKNELCFDTLVFFFYLGLILSRGYELCVCVCVLLCLHKICNFFYQVDVLLLL